MSTKTPRYFVIVLLLIHSINGVDIDLADYIPTDIDCKVNNSIANSLADEQKLEAVISWYIERDFLDDIRSFNIFCHCTVSGLQIYDKDLFYRCDPLCSRQITLFNKESCYDECHCSVQSNSFVLHSSNMNWSAVSTCRIGPKAPKASPMIVSSPIRKDFGNSIEIVFKLPAENLYCDSTDVINRITVNVTDPVDGSYQCIYDQPRVVHTDEGNYKFTFQVEHHQFWRPFNITISVQNSIGSSPFSDHMIVRGANNGDITKTDYKLEFFNDGNLYPEMSTLHFYWNLSRKAENIMDSQFITGFMINIETGNDTIYTTSLLKHLVLNITLEPNQWYLIIGRILTVDNDTWGPEPIYKYFQTPGLPEHSSSSNDNNCLLVIILSIMILVTILVVNVLLYITRAPTRLIKLCHSDYDDDDDNRTDKMTEIIGTVAGSYAEHRCDPSTVENMSYGGFFSKNQDNSTNDLDSIQYIDECNISILKSTAV